MESCPNCTHQLPLSGVQVSSGISQGLHYVNKAIGGGPMERGKALKEQTPKWKHNGHCLVNTRLSWGLTWASCERKSTPASMRTCKTPA